MKEIEDLINKIDEIDNLPNLEKIKSDLLGKEGLITKSFKLISQASKEEKISLGQRINILKTTAEAKLLIKKEYLEEQKNEFETENVTNKIIINKIGDSIDY